jgi:hypothetical protein
MTILELINCRKPKNVGEDDAIKGRLSFRSLSSRSLGAAISRPFHPPELL